MFEIQTFYQCWLASRKSLLRFLSWFFLANSAIFWLIGMYYLDKSFSNDTLFHASSHVYNILVDKSIILLFTALSFIGHFGLLAFMPFFLCLIPLTILYKRPLLTIALAIFCSTASVFFLLLDSIIFLTFHTHLNFTFLNTVFSQRLAIIQFFSLSISEMISIIALGLLTCLIIFATELLIARFIWKKMILVNRFQFEHKLIGLLSLCLLCSYGMFLMTVSIGNHALAQQTGSLPLYQNVLAAMLPMKDSLKIIERFSETHLSEPLFADAPLKYPLHPLQCNISQAPYNILMIGIDAWRFDAMNRSLTPNIAKFSEKSWQFNNHMSGGNSTKAGLFSLFYGLPSHYWNSMLKQKTGPVFIDQLLKQHYQTKILFSADIGIIPFDKTIFYQLKDLSANLVSSETSVIRDQWVTNQFLAFIESDENKQPFFSFLFYDTTHSYCTDQDIKIKHHVKSIGCNRLLLQDINRKDIINHYKNAVNFVDNEVQKILATLEKKGLLQNTIVIITGDHGEEFNDNQQGYWGHGSNFTHYQIQTPLIMYWPNTPPNTVSHQTNHYEIVPFLMKQMLGCKNPTSDYSVGDDLLTTTNRPYLLVGSYSSLGIIDKNTITTLLTSGDTSISDQQARTLPDSMKNDSYIKQALFDMRKYYKTH